MTDGILLLDKPAGLSAGRLGGLCLFPVGGRGTCGDLGVHPLGHDFHGALSLLPRVPLGKPGHGEGEERHERLHALDR
ncbi:MAG: hypothetical protein EBS39_04170, partial [Gammaproteobacteria bacterium]|nr:hypothetical protein [Gammaproteobacteria bacterium]